MRILVNTTTFPNSSESPVPRFVLDQILHFRKIDPSIDIDVLVPQHAYSKVLPKYRVFDSHREIRYHYFWPWRFEKLTGRGIMPALKENPFRALLIPFHLLFQYLSLRQVCLAEKPDVVYAHWFMTPAAVSYFVCKKLDIPLVFTTHASDVSVLKKVPFAKKFITRVLNYAQAFTAVSGRTENKLKSFYTHEEWVENYKNKMHVVPMGVELPSETSDSSQTSKLLIEAGIDTTKNYILTMGRLAQKKGIKYLIDAYGQLSDEQQLKNQLIVAGDGQLLQELEKRAAEIDHAGEIIFTGYVHGDLKYALQSRCRVFVLPSVIDEQGDSEGLPVTLMEAMANGRIVVATNVSGAEEVINDEVGYLVSPNSSNQLCDAMAKVLDLTDSEVHLMQLKTRELSTQFEWPRIAEIHIDLLKMAVHDHSK